MRAAAQGLLDTDKGCPPTYNYVLREAMILREVERRCDETIGNAVLQIHTADMETLIGRAGDYVLSGRYSAARDDALLNVFLLARQMFPWDQSWSEKIKQTQQRIYNRRHEIGDTGFTETGIVNLIREYERAKADWLRKNRKPAADEPDRPANH